MAGLSRRTVLKALGWGAAGITAAAGAGWAYMPTLPPRNAADPSDAAAWISLRPDGRFELYSSRSEMGQGISTGLRQIAAEEMNVPVEAIRLVLPDTALIPVCRSTVGSDAMRETGPLMARAAAALAGTMLREASRRLALPVETLKLTAAGIAGDRGVLLGFDELAAEGPLFTSEDEVSSAKPKLLGPPAWRTIGHAYPTHAIESIVTGGAALYADDIRLADMVFGARIRPQALASQIISIDDRACRSIAGYLGLFREGDFAGIVATRRGALAQALDVLAVEERETEPVASTDIMGRVDIGRIGGGFEHTVLAQGDPGEGPFDVDLTLSVPFAAHASIEPRTAVARFGSDGRLEVWTGTQDPFFVRDSLADAFGLSKQAVVVHGMRIGGGFGARTIVEAEMDAARLSRLCGRPVKVQWSRRDEFRAGFHRPASSHRIRVSADADGAITHWHHAFRSGHIIFTSAAMGPGLQFATSFVADPGVARGSVPPYAADHIKVEFEDVRLPVKTGPWRGLGAAANCWAIETAIDALARAKGIDPLMLRLQVIAPEHGRLRAVLKAAADLSGWERRPHDAADGSFGLACGIYKGMSYAAAVARVTQRKDGYKVTGLWCAHDCGLVINPDQVRAQVEGNLVWGIGMALGEELVVEDGRIAAESFFDYAIPRFSDVPEIEIRLIEGSPVPTGAGETAIVCAAAAVTNAIAALTGEAVTRLPVRAT